MESHRFVQPRVFQPEYPYIDQRLVHAGLRDEGVFFGERDDQGDPLPEFIGARAQDLADLMHSLLDTNERMRQAALDPVLRAAAKSFGFVYIHPFQDGNGRLHRCLIHHVLAERSFTPPGMIFPISSAMLSRIDEYRKSLQEHSSPLMNFVEWRPTPDRNVEVLNEPADPYRFFDCTENAEFLYGCVEQTAEEDLPQEINYLKRHDEAMRRTMELVEMPDQMAEDLLMFIRKNNSKLGKKRGQFAKLTDEEVMAIEAIVREAFEGFAGA
jgi:Fic/DOC family